MERPVSKVLSLLREHPKKMSEIRDGTTLTKSGQIVTHGGTVIQPSSFQFFVTDFVSF